MPPCGAKCPNGARKGRGSKSPVRHGLIVARSALPRRAGRLFMEPRAEQCEPGFRAKRCIIKMIEPRDSEITRLASCARR